MTVSGGKVLAKGGAGAVQCVGVSGGLGLAVKIDDGVSGPASQGRPTAVAAIAALQQILSSASGARVGGAHATFDLTDQLST